MIAIALVLSLAVLFDLLFGDPRRWHPVVGIGRLTGWLGAALRKLSGERPLALRTAGTLTALGTVLLCGGLAWFAIRGLEILIEILVETLIEDLIASGAAQTWIVLLEQVPVIATALLLAFMIATRSLESHALAVYRALRDGDLALARERTSWIVGRDTAQLPEAELVRATVECVAESVSDGISGPLFYAAVGGWLGGVPGAAAGAVVYRSVNTMDSMFGYRNAKYRDFGAFPARLDDLANLLPARLSVPAIVLAAWVLRAAPLNAIRIWWRDALKHTSPNAGQGEAAFAGALAVQLGGDNLYGGVVVEKPRIGDRTQELRRDHILKAVRLMVVAVLWFTIGLVGVMLAL